MVCGAPTRSATERQCSSAEVFTAFMRVNQGHPCRYRNSAKKILLSVDERALSTARQRDRQALFRNDTSRQRACARHPEL
jgi:hypothetical protein